MCELFAMSSRFPTNVTLSLEELARHGGETGPHADGWGVAYYEDYDVRILREPSAAWCSPLMKYLQKQGVQSHIVISHIRKATHGTLKLSNTHPFQRELQGRIHTFAHNGELGELEEFWKQKDKKLEIYQPVGDTDSEYAFCVLMHRLREIWTQPKAPSISDRIDIISRFAEELRPFGPANFLYTDGEYLFAHGHKRTQPDGQKRPPGLYYLNRACLQHKETPNFVGVTVKKDKEQVATLLASVPLSHEGWQPLEEGQLLVIRQGNIIK